MTAHCPVLRLNIFLLWASNGRCSVKSLAKELPSLCCASQRIAQDLSVWLKEKTGLSRIDKPAARDGPKSGLATTKFEPPGSTPMSHCGDNANTAETHALSASSVPRSVRNPANRKCRTPGIFHLFCLLPFASSFWGVKTPVDAGGRMCSAVGVSDNTP
jgi:hypothetical protein